MNTPYVKKFDKNGNLVNPIVGSYNSLENYPQNRAQRRKKDTRFRGNTKGVSLTIVKTEKYKRVIQIIQVIQKNKKGEPLQQTVENNHIVKKRINHYI